MTLGLAVPMLNEAVNAKPVLLEICQTLDQTGIPFVIAAINNGSHDKTGMYLDELQQQEPRILPLHFAENQGYGGGILAGLQRLLQTNATVIGWMWGDGQVSPTVLPELYRACNQGYKLAKTHRTKREDGRRRWLISTTYALVMQQLGIQSPDVNGCPKLMQREALQSLELDATDWFLDAQCILRTEAMGWEVFHHHTTMKRRRAGTSKVNWRTVAEFINNIAQYKWHNQ